MMNFQFDLSSFKVCSPECINLELQIIIGAKWSSYRSICQGIILLKGDINLKRCVFPSRASSLFLSRKLSSRAIMLLEERLLSAK